MKFGIMMAHKKLFALGLTTVAAGSLALGTMLSSALYTDTRTDQSTFTTGTIVLDATKIAAMDLTSAAMMPGDTKTSSVEVENDGSAQLRYSVAQTSTNADTKNLRDALNAVVTLQDTGTGNTFAEDGDYCDDATGTSLHTSAPLGASGNLVGDPTQGGQSGDRTLAAGTHDILCFYVSLDITAPNSSQGSSTTTTFSFAAEQTANNL
jgi:hypothetical protein